MEQNKYIFEKIVKDENDIYGMIGYCFYKFKKVNTIHSIKNMREGNPPSPEELLKFQDDENKNIEKYITMGSSLFLAYVNNIIKPEEEKIENYKNRLEKLEINLNERKKELDKREKSIDLKNKHCKAQPSGFWYGVWQSLTATGIYILICVLLIAFIKYGDIVTWFINTINKN